MSKKHIENMLCKYAKCNPVRFHMPGHKGKVNSYDVTEISATDNLNNPENNILDALTALKKSYGSAYSFFMVNGATGGIHTMLKYASAGSSKPILISRNAHKSILSGCMLFNIDTIILDDLYDDGLQTFVFDEKQVLDAVKEHELSAVVITSVDYFGRIIDVSNISKICREKDILLLCDEAHGAHFHISDMLPESTLAYADICVHSPHKTLSALTQCAYVHINNRIDADKFVMIMHSLQTSSPSFLLAESMDNARYDADTMKSAWESRAKSTAELCEKLNGIDGIKVCDKQWAQVGGYQDKDITRLVIDVSEIGSGISIGKTLEEEHNIFLEMTSFKYLIGILTPFDDEDWDDKLYAALCKISKSKRQKWLIPNYPQRYRMKVKAHKVFDYEWEKVPLKDAAGRIAAASVGVYPPGVPLVLPGELITQEASEYILEVKKLGGSIFGALDGCVDCIKN